MARMPDAQWRPLPRPGTTKMARYDLVVIHTCVGSLEGTDGYFRSGKTSANSHFGTGGHGEIRQWVDTAVRSAANGAGNHRSITIENADMGPGFGAWNTGDGNAVPAFTAAQLEANARIVAWAHKAHGVPLVAADTSRPNSRGIGYHRLGCDPWRVPDGELWSAARGKVCPGPKRIAQIPQIIARAKQIVNGEDDMPSMHEFLNTHAYTGGPTISEVFMTLHQRSADPETIARQVVDREIVADAAGQPVPLWRALASLYVDSLGGSQISVRALADTLRPLILEAVRAGMAADNQATADQIVDRLANRLGGKAA